ncbi:tRNA (adenosine(37)-N6)-threonylcarbamoyltransferase complex dimerization subunit type 1 TsaB [Mumia sp. zg.B53]|uniref:tRNA (adenosine(37)-N6)-threonylcarbamoyltransferase complex dimerization subunit type 1 TsaB n=1 Tax=unclassified Mumia TaxID=2621872 RepID=UPI001C6E86D2|nr:MULTISPECIES: tRNA (adenosine(37)-N6)-threonylcarbamoyltransferase complex dimerization subunit type 1 TsaB [unclassified Mumia]MBW9204730.1 tRNA (adenosine(37)-N6)-threonylcarbamoyltransferase complex dimerization subunit type 1 TsaB [Mumia sp. zg.B17]MBW9209265.1 tRNA (adenosine(37)-N6)-threonylcarbamoyltransferase complex dimerization subunit type 1 TsaB [Mumia sp. zg.B21]MBW9213874.1 tRNA (adenosine(37)-N6)-threonylcarbamoyltransferase complex dimerization subunit type 1 TsaB [Mumia sp. z
MLILALDTAAPATSVALHDGTTVLASDSRPGAMSHGEMLAPAIAAVLARAGVDRRDVTDVAVGVGPGPFTGLRVGVVTARTLAVSLHARLHGVCSLDVIAAEAVAAGAVEDAFVVATDARRKEVYWAEYTPRGERVGDADVMRPADLAARLPSTMPVLGRGADLYAEVLARVDGPADPDAGVLAGMVAAGTAVEVGTEPLYLRRPDAAPAVQRKRASA